MSRSRRDRPSSRRPRPQESEAAAGGDELIPVDDELIPIGDDDELDVLEEWTPADEVEITCAPAAEEQFDVRLTIGVGDMEKSAITSAIDAPLRSKVKEFADGLRWRRVVVTFSGDAVIPTACKELIAEVLPGCRPLSVTVQRGYPDELVHQDKLPSLSVTASGSGAELQVDVDTSGLDAVDLEAAWQPEFEKLCSGAAGQRITFRFRGGPTPPADALRGPLVEAGVDRITLAGAPGDDVIYDRQIEELVTLEDNGDQTVVKVGAGDLVLVRQALENRFRQERGHVTGRPVTVRFASGPATDEQIGMLVAMGAEYDPLSLETDGDILWPPLLAAHKDGGETLIRFEPGGRSDPARALARELPALHLAGQAITLDLPAGMAVDEELERQLIAAGPRSLARSHAGEARIPVWPAPLTSRTEADRVVIELDTEAGLPVELVRVLQRDVPGIDVDDKEVDVYMRRAGTVSRTMRRTLVQLLQDGGAKAARMIDQQATTFLFPDLLDIADLGDGGFHIGVDLTGRDPADIAADAADLLQEHALAGARIRLRSSPVDQQLIELLLARDAGRIVLQGDTDLQVHPTLFRDATRDGDDLTITAAPDADDAALAVQLEHELPVVLEEQGDLSAATVTLVWPGADDPVRTTALERILAAGAAVLRLDDGTGIRQLHPEIVPTYVEVLGRRDTATPPMIMLAVDTGDVDGATGALTELLDELDGRRVLVVFRAGGRDISGPHDDPVVQATHALVGPRAAAELHFRAPAGGVPAHFKVVSSSIDGLARGAKVRDPRTADG